MLFHHLCLEAVLAASLVVHELCLIRLFSCSSQLSGHSLLRRPFLPVSSPDLQARHVHSSPPMCTSNIGIFSCVIVSKEMATLNQTLNCSIVVLIELLFLLLQMIAVMESAQSKVAQEAGVATGRSLSCLALSFRESSPPGIKLKDFTATSC